MSAAGLSQGQLDRVRADVALQRAIATPPQTVTLPAGTVLWHGGAPGLRPGDLVLPPARSFAVRTLADYTPEAERGRGLARRDRVYVTTSLIWAAFFACAHPAEGCIYQVEPFGDVEIDPDFSGERVLSFQCLEARVLTVSAPTRRQEVESRKYMRKLLRKRDRALAAAGDARAATRLARGGR